MRFKEWLNEMAGIQNMDTSHIDLMQTIIGSGYEYNFKIKNERFTVNFVKSTKNILDSKLTAWTIALHGPQHFQATNKMEGGAAAVYTQLLLSIKKLFETEEVNLIRFSPSSDKMSSVYDRFFDKYLSKDFIRLETYYYIRKTTLREILSQKDRPRDAQEIYSRMISTNRERLKNKKDTEERSNLVRRLRLIAPSVVGKFIVFHIIGDKTGYVKHFENSGSPYFEVTYYDDYTQTVHTINVSLYRWLPDKKPDPFQVKRLMNAGPQQSSESPSLIPPLAGMS